MLSEYAAIVLMCSMTTILFLGGWLPPVDVWFLNWVPGIVCLCATLPLRPVDASGLESLPADFAVDGEVSVFETSIRLVGGLLSAHHACGDPVLLAKARDLADRLLPAFDTPTGMPYPYINLKTGVR
eukprot:gene48586-65940_t